MQFVAHIQHKTTGEMVTASLNALDAPRGETTAATFKICGKPKTRRVEVNIAANAGFPPQNLLGEVVVIGIG